MESKSKHITVYTNRPGLDWGSVDEAGKWMIKQRQNWNLNRPDWGWANEEFEEFIFDGNSNA